MTKTIFKYTIFSKTLKYFKLQDLFPAAFLLRSGRNFMIDTADQCRPDGSAQWIYLNVQHFKPANNQ